MAPRTIGRYEIKSELGRGGMATVYLAYDPRFRREVAVKVLPPAFLSDPLFRRRFDREAQTVASVEHPAIVPVYDYGEDAGQLFLVMRYMSGGSLADRIRSGPLPLDEVIAILGHLAPGLDEAHRRGVIHRDLKPDNVLFDSSGHPMLSDFGIAKLAEHTTALTVGGMIGTPAYISPEQAAGSKETDGRSDVYSLGVVLFQMLTGKLPYEAPTPVGLALKHIREPVPSLHEYDPSLARLCDRVIARAMAKKPRDRYQTSGELVRALESCAKSKAPPVPWPIPKRHPPRATVSKEQSNLAGTADALGVPEPLVQRQRHQHTARGLLTIGGVIVIGTVAGTIMLLGRGPKGGSPPAEPTEVSTLFVTATESAFAVSSPTGVMSLTEAPSKATPSMTPTSRPVVIGKENVSGLAVLETIDTDDSGDFAWSSDGALLAIAGKTLTVWDVAAQRTAYFFDTEGTPFESWRQVELYWEPGGTRLAGWSMWGVPVWIYEAGSQGDLRALDSEKTGSISSIEWAPAGRTLGMGTAGGDIVLWDATTDALEYINADHSQLVSGISWSPDGKLVGSSSWDGTVQIFEAAGGARVRILGGMGGSLDGILWSPDGGLVALRSWYEGPVSIWDSGTWARVATAEGTPRALYSSMSWSPDGNYLLLSSENEIVVWRRRGDLPELVVPDANSAAWSPNSRMLAAASKDHVTISSAPDWQPAFVLEGHSGPVAWSPDGAHLLARHLAGGVSILGIPR